MKDLTRQQLEQILTDDDLGIFTDDLNEKEKAFAYSFVNALIDWCEKYPEKKKLFNIKK